MALTITPTTQHRYLDPYEQRLFDFNTSDSRVYVSRETNNLLKIFGNDFILKGLTVTKTIENSIIEFTIIPGYAIADTTLIDIQSTSTLSIDLTPYSATGQVIVYLSYEYLNTVISNPVQLKTSYLDSSGNVWPNGWNSSKDRIILAIVNFTKDESNNILTATFDYTSVTISSVVYEHTIKVDTVFADYIEFMHSFESLTFEDQVTDKNLRLTTRNGHIYLDEVITV